MSYYPSLNGSNKEQKSLEPATPLIRRNRPIDQAKSPNLYQMVNTDSKQDNLYIPQTPLKKEIKQNQEQKKQLKPVEYKEVLYDPPKNKTLTISNHPDSIALYRQQELMNTYGLTMDDLRAFEYFWNAYPRKTNRIRAQQAWFHDGCNKIAGRILIKLSEQIEKDNAFLTGYAPSITSYIHGQRWNDDIQHAPKNNCRETKSADNTLVSTDWRKGRAS